MDKDGKYIRFEEEHVERAYSTEEITQLLHSASFKDIYMYNGLSFEEIHDKSERISFIAMT